MADIKKVLTEEIKRLARKEANALVAPLAAKIAELKKTVSAQAKQIKAFKPCTCNSRKEEKAASDEANDKKSVRLNGAGIRRVREKLALSQKDFAALIGASHLSVCHWELGKSEPRSAFKVSIASLRHIGKRKLASLYAAKNIKPSSRKRSANSSKAAGDTASVTPAKTEESK